MNWLWEKQKFTSQFNGQVELTRLFGRYAVTSEGHMESSRYTRSMWRHALRCKIGLGAKIKKVLLLGLGTGSCLDSILLLYKNSHITAVDIDPLMIELFQQVWPKDQKSRIEIVCGDAGVIIARLTQSYDLIILDLFYGNTLPGLLLEKGFASGLAQRLSRNGYLLTNFWMKAGILKPIYDSTLTLQEIWKFRDNRLCIYRPPLPTGYSRYRGCKEFIQREKSQSEALIQAGQCWGRQKNFRHWILEGYTGDTTPVIIPSSKWKYVTWQPTRPTPVPPGWHLSLLRGTTKAYGLAVILNNNEYWHDWSQQAQRQRQQWLNQYSHHWIISETAPEEFYAGIKQAHLGWGLAGIFIDLLKHKLAWHGRRVKIFGARKTHETQIAAGLTVLHVPEAKTSVHLAAFHLPEARHENVGVGLIDAWYKSAIKQNLVYLDFGVMRAQGEPHSWQGFTDFKNQFVTHTIYQPRLLWQIVKPTDL